MDGFSFGARSHHTLQLICVIGIHINFIRHTHKPQIKINEILNIKKNNKNNNKNSTLLEHLRTNIRHET